MLVVLLDVDGTLASAGGPILGYQVEKLNRPDITWGILSSRSKEGSQEACDALGIEPAFIEVCRVDMRAEELLLLKERHPADRYVYVADREVDRQEALKAGWEFCFAHKFEQLLEEVT